MIHRVRRRKPRGTVSPAVPKRVKKKPVKKVAPKRVRKKKPVSSKPDLLPDFDRIGKGYGIWHVVCKATGKDYDAGFCDWNRKYGFICIKCGMEQGFDCPDHTVKHVARKA